MAYIPFPTQPINHDIVNAIKTLAATDDIDMLIWVAYQYGRLTHRVPADNTKSEG